MARDDLLSRLHARPADAGDAERLKVALQLQSGPLAVYLALPPAVFEPAILALAGATLPPRSRVVVDKPFGEGVASARRLNALLAQCLPDGAVHRMDHFLGKQTVQNVLGLRFANRVFEPLWNRHHIAKVEIVWDEELTLEGRAGYYDQAGALRDMVQNHRGEKRGCSGTRRQSGLVGHDCRRQWPLAPREGSVRGTGIGSGATLGGSS